MRNLLGLVFVLLFVFLSSCTSTVGPEGPAVGGRCIDEFDCSAGSFCLTEFPDGACTRNCGSTSDCPGGSSCIDLRGGVCVLRCTSATDCREGYACNDRMRLEGETARVCVAP